MYYSLKLLKERGFIAEIIKSGVQYYKAVSPTRIPSLIKEEQEKKKEIIDAVLPQLQELESNTLETPNIEFYEGYEGFKTIFARLLEKPHKEFLCYLSSRPLEFLPHFHEQFRKRRKERKIKIRTLTEDTRTLREIKKLDKDELRETRFYPVLFKNNEAIQYILDDAVVVIKANKTEQIGMYIQDKNFANLQRSVFEELWKKSIK